MAAGGIEMHTQLVIVPGMNDGEVLTRSLHDLAARFPAVRTIAVVPVGLTRHRERLPNLRAFTREDAIKALEEVHAFQGAFRKARRTRVAFAADEMYVLAGEEVPPARAYEGFPQLENGIGMLRQTIDAWRKRTADVVSRNGRRERVAVVTGASAGPTLARLFAERPPVGVDVSLCVVGNEYFGDTVTVSGLLVGADIEAALRRHGPVDRVLLPPNCLKDREVFLDDRTRSGLEGAIGAPVQIGFDEPAAA
jgi:NifB/MoaA-like Fe-S oxidoreductase